MTAAKCAVIQQISAMPITDSDSVGELAEVGKVGKRMSYKAVENAKDSTVSEVITHEIPDDPHATLE
jgi:hypothetical protein